MKKVFLIAILYCIASMAQGQSLPKIILHNDSTTLQQTFTTGQLTFIQEEDTTSYSIQLRRRGATSLLYDKPSFAVKICDEQGAKLDASFLGMRSDNYWILDAMASDKARMRNRAAMDLWLEIAPDVWYKQQEPGAINGYRGEMVEVWSDSVPMGIYCLMERLDRKQLKLKKYNASKGIRGTFYKSYAWSDAVNFRLTTQPLPSDTMITWEGWEMGYPDYEDGEAITWDPLVGLLDFVSNRRSEVFADSIAMMIDMPTYINYCLIVNLLSARDNAGKNNYWSFYDIQQDTKSTISLWDMDHSWGRMYNSQEEETNYILPKNHLYQRCMSEVPGFVDALEERYAQLREEIFTVEHLDGILEKYFTLFAETHMDSVEIALWSGHNNIEFDIQSEKDYIHDWLIQRLAVTDTYYHYMPHATQDITSDPSVTRVYDIYGHYISDTITGLPSGLYLYRHDGITSKIFIVQQ